MIGEPVQPGEIPFLDEGLSLLTKKYPPEPEILELPHNVEMIQLALSDVVLDKKYNPLAAPEYQWTALENLREACGLIPEYFAMALGATVMDEHGDPKETSPTIQELAEAFDRQHSEFAGSRTFTKNPEIWSRGKIENTIYKSGDGDPDLWPILQAWPRDIVLYGNKSLLVYEHGICAIINPDRDEYIVGHCD